jgi:hypothetical protein
MSSDFGINVHPDAGDIRVEKFSDFHTLVIGPPDNRLHRLAIFIGPRDACCVLDALTAALAEIRADMDQDARDQVPTEMADWPAGPPGELVEAFGK